MDDLWCYDEVIKLYIECIYELYIIFYYLTIYIYIKNCMYITSVFCILYI
jgi:hypothetical protein